MEYAVVIPRYICETDLIACYGVGIVRIESTKVPVESLCETRIHCAAGTFINNVGVECTFSE